MSWAPRSPRPPPSSPSASASGTWSGPSRLQLSSTSPDSSVSDQARETREALGARLRGFRKDVGFSSGRAFAAATGWQESKVSRIENGKQNASEEDIRVWCQIRAVARSDFRRERAGHRGCRRGRAERCAGPGP
ncbi:helix-turn-helix domain-containing protein, partial [Streptomyces sp. NPDC090026]|uniref:helix-turn-helix domain-containing protein n=1 Tax=Streptomyces sp. NPDC090026 TaxID=3365923 RepID=UPI0037F1496B